MIRNITPVQGIAMVIALGLVAVALTTTPTEQVEKKTVITESEVIPTEGIVLPIQWGDVGIQMVQAGVIDQEAFEAIYANRGGMGEDMERLLSSADTDSIVITPENSGVLLNILWAFGLGNKNSILDEGPMVSEEYGGNAGGFASTGGWTLAKGDAMNHYSMHSFVVLTDEQQGRVERVSKGIFRPCCGNATYFPDCNHGMAMLGLLELLAAEDMSEDEMYEVALQVNAYWFPDTYLTIAQYFANKGVAWSDVDPREVLGFDYSSGQGYARVLQELEPTQFSGGASCGV